MKVNFCLEADDNVILKDTSVSKGEGLSPYTDELYLTNRELIWINKNVRRGPIKAYHYPLNKLKLINEIPQAKITRKQNGKICLTLLFINGQQEDFSFDFNNKRKIKRFIDNICNLFGFYDDSAYKENKIVSGYLWTSFKDIGHLFADFGKSMVSDIGFNNKDTKGEAKNRNESIAETFAPIETVEELSSDVTQEVKESNEYMINYELDSDEVILKKIEGVYLFGTFEKEIDTMIITNKNIVLERDTGFWRSKVEVDILPYTDLKYYKGKPQVKHGKYEDEPVLEVYCTDKIYYFNFCESGNEHRQIELIKEIVNDIVSACNLENQSELENNDLCNSQTWICRNCGKINNVTNKFCIECGQKYNEKENNKDQLTLEEQIELLKKLKELFDEGILTQEEFEAKKKEIL